MKKKNSYFTSGKKYKYYYGALDMLAFFLKYINLFLEHAILTCIFLECK
jgi:hypothetical protein